MSLSIEAAYHVLEAAEHVLEFAEHELKDEDSSFLLQPHAILESSLFNMLFSHFCFHSTQLRSIRLYLFLFFNTNLKFSQIVEFSQSRNSQVCSSLPVNRIEIKVNHCYVVKYCFKRVPRVIFASGYFLFLYVTCMHLDIINFI